MKPQKKPERNRVGRHNPNMDRQKGKALKLLMTGMAVNAVADAVKLGRSTVVRIKKANQSQIDTGFTKEPEVSQKLIEQTIVETESLWIDKAAENFQGMATDAMDRLKEMVQKPKAGEEPPNPVRFQACKYILDRIMPSADAKVGAKATVAAGQAHADAIDRALTVDPEEEARLLGTRKVFRDVVEKRKPLIQYRGEATAASVAASGGGNGEATGGNGKLGGNGEVKKGDE